MIPVQQAMPAALELMLRNAPLSPEKIAFAWRVTVGAAVDRATRVELRGDVLHVRAKDVEWRRAVERSLPLIHKRVTALLGECVVGRIDLAAP